jgi:hypothetical protein
MLFSVGDGSKLTSLAVTLAEQIQQIGKARNKHIFGTGMTNAGVTIQRMHRTAGELVYAITQGQPLDDILKLLQQLEANLQVAATMGVLSSSELEPYLRQVDALYELIDKETP